MTEVFTDDFSDGLWTKHPGNPVLVRSQPWAESDYVCEPNLLYREGQFHCWFSQMFPADGRTALGYATSPDGLTWTKHPGNPVLHPPGCEVHRPSVMEHAGVLYCFAVDDEFGRRGPSTMRRWESRDGVHWSAGQLVMTADQDWEEGTLSNMAVLVDERGRWQMLYTRIDRADGQHHKGYFGYAWSEDGRHWTKYPGNPVITGFYGGDPCLVKIGDRTFTWHSEASGGSLRVYCRQSTDMVHWEPVGTGPQISYSQPWERGVPAEQGGTTRSYYGHLTDATLCEANGRVLLMYQGAQTPLGVASFDGTLEELAARLQRPPLARWLPSPYGMVDGQALKLSDNGSVAAPLVAPVAHARARYTIQARLRCEGATHQASLVFRYAPSGALARLWLHDNAHTYVQERLHGLWSEPVNLGPNQACDEDWHEWRIEIAGAVVRASVGGCSLREWPSSAALLAEVAEAPVHVGFAAQDTWLSVDWIRVTI